MKIKPIISIILFGFLLISPIVSYNLKAQDQTNDSGPKELGTVLDEYDKSKPVKVLEMNINGAIGIVAVDRIELAIEQAENAGAELLVIYMDTPGGFTNATWSICKNILNSEIPVCIYIAPKGARAGSAGVYITYAAHFAAMAPSTNIGAAHPVAGGGEEIDSVMNEKITNDAAAQIRAAAVEHGRNAEWAEKAVRESVSITDVEALELNVIDMRADDFDDLMAQINGRTVEMPDGTKTMATTNVEREEIHITFAQQVLKVISDPNIVFILFSIGSMAIVIELYNPGAILPGVVGAIFLLVAFYGSQTLPVNYAGVALIFLAVIMFVAEIKIISHGLLTIGGLVSLFLGGLMLIDTVDPILKVSLSVLISTVVTVGVCVAFAAFFVIKAIRRKVTTGSESMIDKIAVCRKPGFVYLDGALWKIDENPEFSEGTKVRVVGIEGLKLIVKLIE